MMAEVEHRSMADRITEKIHEYKGSSSSSDSEGEKPSVRNAMKKRLFGRRESLHKVLGGGKSADIILWRQKQMSGSIFAGVTVIWLLFECMGYHLLTFICHAFIFLLAVLFVWSNAASFVNRSIVFCIILLTCISVSLFFAFRYTRYTFPHMSPPSFPEVILPEDLFLKIAHSVRHEINEAFITFRYVASGNDLKTFLMTVAGLWVVSVIGSWFSFLTLCYIVFVALYTLPVLYEKYEDHVDTAAGKAMVEINKHYAVLDAKVLQKIPRGPFADKKHH